MADDSVSYTWDKIHSSNKERAHPLAEQVYPSRIMQTFVDFHINSYLTENREYQFLDVGCGSGANLDAITEYQQIRKHGIDISRSAIGRCQLRHPSGRFSCGESTSLPYQDEYFDFAYAEGSLYYCSKQEYMSESIGEIRRVLKPNGICRIYTKAIVDKAVPVEFQGESHYIRTATTGWEKGLPIMYASKGLIVDMLAGFRLVKIGCDMFSFVDSDAGMHAFWVVTATK